MRRNNKGAASALPLRTLLLLALAFCLACGETPNQGGGSRDSEQDALGGADLPAATDTLPGDPGLGKPDSDGSPTDAGAGEIPGAEEGPEPLDEGLSEAQIEISPDDADSSEASGPELLETSAEVAADTWLDEGGAEVSPPSCTPDPPVAASGARSVFVTHPFGGPGVCGTTMARLILDEAGALATTGEIYEVGACPKVAEFSPDGRLLIVLTIDNDPQAGTRSAVVYRHHADGSLTRVRIIDVFATRAIADLSFSPDGTRAYITDENIEGEGGVHVLTVDPGCDAQYKGWIDLHHASSIAVLPGGAHAAVMAGPSYNDDHDIAFLDLASETVAARYDRFSDFVDDYSIAVHPDGGSMVVPNASMFSDLANTVTVLGLSYETGTPVPTVLQVLEDVAEPTDVRYSSAGDKLLVTNFSDNTVRWFTVDGAGLLSEGGTITSVPLADRTSALSRGPNDGLILVSAVTRLVTLRFTEAGMIREATLDLAEGLESGIPVMIGDVAIEP